MVISFMVAVYFQFVHGALGLPTVDPSLQLVIGVAVTTVGWITVTYLTPPADAETLRSFHQRIRPMGTGWRGAGLEPDPDSGSPSAAFLAWFLGCVVIYAALFGTGYALYGQPWAALACLAAAGGGAIGVMRVLPRIELR
jgi:hypothetical protein